MTTLIGRNILRLRRQAGLSQVELAARAGTSQSWISRLESKSANPTLDSVTRIARALGVRVAELMQDVSDQAA